MFLLFYVAFFMAGEGVVLMTAKLKNIILHEVLCPHFAVCTEEYHDWPETKYWYPSNSDGHGFKPGTADRSN